MPAATGTLALTSDLSGYVTLATTQTISGSKTFSSSPIIDNGTSGIPLRFKQYASTNFGLAGYTDIIPVGATLIAFAFGQTGADTKIAYFSAASLTNNVPQEYTLPNATGTLALLSGTQTFTGATTFSSDLLVSGLTIGRGGSAVVGNTAIGAGTLAANTTGVFNTAIGYYALASNTIGVSNTAIGANSLLVNTTGNNNTAIGTDSLNVNTTGSRNTAIGYYALNANTTANNNAAIGYYTLVNNTTGAENLGVGNEALRFNTVGNNNVAIGNESLRLNTTGTSNTSIGVGALYSNTTGGNNIAIGYNSATSITTGSNNTIIGGYVGTAAMANNIVLADGAGTIRYQWNGTNNAFTGAATFSSSVTANGNLNLQGAVTRNINFYDSSNTNINAQIQYDQVASNSGQLFFGTNNGGTFATRLTITNAGNVGIGTSSPAAKLEIQDGHVRLYDPVSTAGAGYAVIWASDNGGTNTSFATIEGVTTSAGNRTGDIKFNTSSAGAPTEKMRITSGGYTKASNNGTYRGATDPYHEFVQTANDRNTIFRSTNASYTSNILLLDAVRSANSAYSFLFANSGDNTDREFDLIGDGNGKCDGAWTGGGADYAEYFEWEDGNINNEDRRGMSVSLIDNKIKIAEQGEAIIGVISGNPSIVGDAAWNKWSGKYLKDDFGSYILDEEGNRTLNPNYNPDEEYITREQRPEWSVVGLMGKLRIRKGQKTMPTWIKMRDVSENVEEWLIK